MDYIFDLLQGLGIAAAIGIRPFLPALLAGALAAADLGLDFDNTSFEFLEQAGFLFAILVAVAVFGVIDRRRGAGRNRPPAVTLVPCPQAPTKTDRREQKVDATHQRPRTGH